MSVPSTQLNAAFDQLAVRLLNRYPALGRAIERAVYGSGDAPNQPSISERVLGAIRDHAPELIKAAPELAAVIGSTAAVSHRPLGALRKVADIATAMDPHAGPLTAVTGPIGRLEHVLDPGEVKAAFKLGDQIFEAASHPQAAKRMAQAGLKARDAIDGFTVGGEFVPRAEFKARFGEARSEQLSGGPALVDKQLSPAEVETPPVTNALQRAKLRAELDETLPQRTAARLKTIRDNLTPAELEQFDAMKPAIQRRVARVYSLMPATRELASAAMAGAGMKGWYESAGAAIKEAFGADAPRFTALLAATSPRKSVQENLIGAVKIWRDWNMAGRPQEADAIAGIMRRSGMVGSTKNGAVRALTLPTAALTDPTVLAKQGNILAGPKVDPFYANLMGEVNRLTLDTHMAKIGPTANAFGSPARKLGASAAVRAAIPEIEKLTGAKWDPREMQEAVWSVVKNMPEMAGRKGIEKFFFPEGGPMGTIGAEAASPLTRLTDRIGQTPDFASLMRSPKVAPLIEEAARPVGAHPVPGLAVDPSLIRPEDLRSLAQRLDAWRKGAFLFGVPLVAGGAAGAAAAGGLLGDQRPAGAWQ